MNKIKIIINKNLKVIFIVLILVAILVIQVIFNINRKYLIENDNYIEKSDKIYVYIYGEVKYEGLYEFNIDTKIKDALNLIGGTTKNADISNINLEKYLSNKEELIIPSKMLDENQNAEEYNTDENNDDNNNSNENSLIDINKANIFELMKIEGVGEKTAQKIIEYREKNKFENINQLLEVNGIGESKLAIIKEYICIK